MNERQKEIVKVLSEYHEVKSIELANIMQVSEETIRRDLKYLERQKILKRVHGGAIRETNRSEEYQFSSRRGKNLKEKKKIAVLAASLIKDGESIAIANGTTTLALAKELWNKKNLTIITNSLEAAIEASANTSNTVYVMGGLLRRDELGISGSIAMEFMTNFHVDKMFFSGGGITIKDGITDFHVEECMLLQAMMENARESICMMDYSKCGLVNMRKICDIKDLDILVMDENVPNKELEAYRKAGVRVMITE